MSSNPYLDALKSTSIATGDRPANPYLDLMQSEEEMRRQREAAQLSQAIKVNPDQYSQQRRVANYLGYSTSVLEAMPSLADQAKVKQVQQDTAATPALQKLYTDADFAKLAHDDSGTLSQIAKWGSAAGSQLWASTRSGLYSLAGAGARVVEAITPTTSASDLAILYKDDPEGLKRMLDSSPAMFLDRAARAAQARSEAAAKDVNELAKERYGNLQYATLNTDQAAYLSPVKVTADALQSLPTTLALAVSAYFTRGNSLKAYETALAQGATREAALKAATAEGAKTMAKVGTVSEATVSAAMQYNQTLSETLSTSLEKSTVYAQLISEGYSPEAAREVVAGRVAEQAGLIAGILNGTVNRVTGKYLGQIISEGGAMLPRIAKGFATESVNEFFQSMGEQFGQNWATMIGVDPDAPLTKGLLESAFAGLFVGGVTGGAFAAVAGRSMEQQNKINAGLKTGDALTEALTIASDSKLRERSPEQFRQALAEMGNDASIYVDGEVLNQLPAEIRSQLPAAVQEKIAEAAAIGDVVAVPVADVLTVAPGTPLEQVFAQNAKTSPDAMSQAEATKASEQAQEFIQQEAERVIQQAADQEAARQSRESVKQSILTELNAAGRQRLAVNDVKAGLAADYFTVMGAKMSVSAEEFYQRYRLRVLGQATGQVTSQDQVLNAETSTPEFRQWFGNSKLVDANGAPLMLYRGMAGESLPDAGVSEMRPSPGLLGTGIYMTSFPKRAAGYATGERGQTYPLYASIQNPISEDDFVERFGRSSRTPEENQAITDQLISEGYDGIVAERGPGRAWEVVAFRPEQVKSVFNERPTQAPGILEQTPGALPDWSLEKAKTRITDAIKKAAIALSPTAKQARKNYDKLDAIFAKVPDPLESEDAWRKFMSLLVADRDVLGVPYNALRYAQSPEAVAEYLSRLRPDQLASRRAGFELGAKIRQEYLEGRATPVTTGRLLLWAMLSRKAGAYPHEAAYMDLVNGGVDQWIEKAVNGNWTEADSEGYVKWSSEFMASKKGGVSPSAGVTSNANDFGRILLTKMSEKDANGETSLTRLHNLIADPNVSTDQVRREFFALGDSLGIQNKVLSFALLVTGRWDTLVLDRVQFTHLWGDQYRERAGQRNIYDNGLAAAGEGHFGLAVYEALSRGMSESVRRGYELAGLTEQGDGTLGAFHWDSWLIESSQAIGHPTIEALDTETPRPDLAVRQGKFDTYSYNFEYRADGQYQIPLLDGGGYIILAPAEAAEFQGRISDPKEGVVPKDFKVSQNKASPWVDAEGVNRGRYDEILAEYGRRADAADVAPAGLADAGGPLQQRSTDAGRADAAAGTAAGDINGQPQSAGDRGGRYSSGSLAPLEGAPNVAGATGPDPRLVAVAEQYARDNGIDLRRQGEYAKVDPERAARIAAAYDAMTHAPQDPAVREAYENLIRQTLAQYQALEAAGYKFYLVDETTDPYGGNPWNAMRDLRANQTMGVFATEAGFGSGATELNVEDNPLLADTGLRWPYGSPDGEPKRVLANDLFRAVHDAFGHGLEGAGFRAQGEENAWQAHIRLFTGSAKGAITSETRGQNSWLNYGPYGDNNRNAKVEETVFADQKTGLMPEWTWAEGIVEDMPEQPLQQGPRGTFNPRTFELILNPNSDLTTFFHELGHFFLEVQADIAGQPDAPAMIVEDMNKILAWFGVPDLATWSSYTLDQKRPYHERFAESFEQYLLEGKAPSVELQPVFRRIRAWFLNAYKSLKAFVEGRPDLQLNDDIRRVFDRMLATDEQIQQANEAAALVPDEQADGEAAERLQKRSLADLKWSVKARDKVIAKLKRDAREIEKATRAEVTAEVDALPESRAQEALDALSVDVEYDGKLAEWNAARKAAEESAKAEVTATMLEAEAAKTGAPLIGIKKGQFLAKVRSEIANKVEARMIEWVRENRKPSKAQYATDSDLAVIADSFGYPSVEEMLQALFAFNRNEIIDAMTEQRMLEEHGDLVDERAIEQAANEAIHNEARARSLATELRTQQEMLGQRTDTGQVNARGAKITVNALIEAAKQFGANVVARTSLRDLRATAWKHTAAERRAGKRWQEHTAKGETSDAVKAKQDQVLNNAAAKAALDAITEAKKILDFFKRVTKGNDEKVVEKGRDPDIVNAARAVLAAYGIETSTTKSAAAYLEALQQNDPETAAVVGPMIAQATQSAQPLEALTFEELQGLHEAVQAMWYLAKRTRQMEVNGDLIDIDEAADELYARMEEIGIPDTVPGEEGALTKAELIKRAVLQQAPALLRRVEQWAEGKDGKFGGPFLRLIFQPIKDHADRYRAQRLEYRKKFQALVDNIAVIMPTTPIEAPELGYTFGRGHNGIGMAELLHAILHTGNESNKRKLLLGRGWASENADGTLDTKRWDAFIQRLVNQGVLKREHFDFAQGVWDLLEQTKPLAQKTHRDVFGRYFAEVTADKFTDPFGVERRGGYVPAQADPLLVQDAELRDLLETENAGMSYAFPSTNRGFTKSRVEYNRPLKLDLRSLPQHIDKVLLFSHMEAPVRAAARLIKRPKVSQPLGRIDPAAISGVLKPWLNRSARQTVETPISADAGMNRMLSTIRGRVGMALMFANISNTLQQITGLSSAAIKVKPSLMMRSLAQYVANPKKFKDTVWDLSPYMADRANNEVAVLSDTLDKILINPSVFETAESFTRQHAYFLQTAFDNQLSPIIWTAAYNQGIEQGMDERMAIRYADGVIRQTQGSTLPEDVSRIETGPAYARIFTQFIGYFNMLANTNATALQQIAQEQGLKKGAGKAFSVLMLGMMVPIWVAEAIALGFKGGPDDEEGDGYLDDWLAQVLGFGTIKGVLSGIPFVGALGQSVVNRFNDKPADDKFSLSPSVSVIESAAGSPASVYKAIVEDASKQKAVRDVAALITVTTGLPAMTVARPLGYLAGMQEGRIEPTGPGDVARGLVTGTASPESKAR